MIGVIGEVIAFVIIGRYNANPPPKINNSKLIQ